MDAPQRCPSGSAGGRWLLVERDRHLMRPDKKSGASPLESPPERRCHSALMKKKKARIRWTQKMDTLLVSLRQEGVPWQEVAVRLGVSLYAAWSRGEKIVKYQ